MQKNTNFVYREQVVLQKSICKQMCGIQNTFSHQNNVIIVLNPSLVHEAYLAVRTIILHLHFVNGTHGLSEATHNIREVGGALLHWEPKAQVSPSPQRLSS